MADPLSVYAVMSTRYLLLPAYHQNIATDYALLPLAVQAVSPLKDGVSIILAYGNGHALLLIPPTASCSAVSVEYSA